MLTFELHVALIVKPLGCFRLEKTYIYILYASYMCMWLILLFLLLINKSSLFCWLKLKQLRAPQMKSYEFTVRFVRLLLWGG